MLWLYRLIRGFLTVEFSGEFAEQMLNIAARQRISMWNLRCRQKKISGNIAVRDFYRLQELRRGTGVRVHICKRHGLPFFAARYRRRYGLTAGAVLFFSILFVLSRFVWTVEVVGNRQVSDRTVLTACREMGIGVATPISKIRPQTDAQRLLLSTKGLAWASFNIEGCVLRVNVTEIRTEKPREDPEPVNLTATEDGIITRIDVTAGNTLVKVGDAVHAGDILVSGILEQPEGTRFVVASGTVTAKTKRAVSVSGKYRVQKTVPAKEVNRRAVLGVFGLNIPLYLGRESGSYESSVSFHRAHWFGKALPLEITVKKYVHTHQVAVNLTKKELKKELRKQVKDKIGDWKLSSAEISEERFSGDSETLTLSCTVTGEENIVAEEKILRESLEKRGKARNFS